jgi:hypothetical protein
MLIDRNWLQLSQGEKMVVLEFAQWKTTQRWEIRTDEKKKAAMAGS